MTSSAVEPATAVSVVTMVSERSVVAARSTTPTASLATTTGVKDDACGHHDHDYRHNYKEHSHLNPPFTGFPHIQASV